MKKCITLIISILAVVAAAFALTLALERCKPQDKDSADFAD